SPRTRRVSASVMKPFTVASAHLKLVAVAASSWRLRPSRADGCSQEPMGAFSYGGRRRGIAESSFRFVCRWIPRAGQEMDAHRVHVEPEHLADVDEREGPRPACAAHPGLGLGGQTTGAKVAAPASLLDAPYRVLQNREHQGAWSGRVAIPARVPEHLRLQDRRQLTG